MRENCLSGGNGGSALVTGPFYPLPKTAARIVEYRRRNGDFESVGELVRVRGIGMRTVERLRPLLRPE